MSTTVTVFCSFENCPQKSSILCYDCNKNYCPIHLKDHDQQLLDRLHPLEITAKVLFDRYEKINTNKLINEFSERLDRWKEESHRAIDQFYKEKREELKEWPDKFNRPKIDLNQFQTRKKDIFDKGRTTHDKLDQMVSTLQFIEQNIKDIEEKGVQIDIPMISLVNSTNAGPSGKIDDIDLINLSTPYRAMNCSNEFGSSISSNQRNILILNNQYLNLINRDLTKVEQIEWNDGIVLDMSFHPKLNSFVLLTDKRTIYQLGDNPIRLTRIQTIPCEKWRCCSCSDDYLYLSTYGPDTYLVQYNVSPSFDRIQYWRSPSTCQSHQTIIDLKSTKETILLLIMDTIKRELYFQIRSSTDLTLVCDSLIDISRNRYQPNVHCCLFKRQQYLILIENSSRIYHISKYGTLISIYNYQPNVFNAVLINSNILAIRTEKKLFLHRV